MASNYWTKLHNNFQTVFLQDSMPSGYAEITTGCTQVDPIINEKRNEDGQNIIITKVNRRYDNQNEIEFHHQDDSAINEDFAIIATLNKRLLDVIKGLDSDLFSINWDINRHSIKIPIKVKIKRKKICRQKLCINDYIDDKDYSPFKKEMFKIREKIKISNN